MKVGSIIMAILAFKFFIYDRFRVKKKDYGRSIMVKGMAGFGNTHKTYVFYENVWAYYDDGQAYSIDIDGVLIDSLGHPYRVVDYGLELNAYQVRKDHDEGVDRYMRAKKKRGYAHG